MNARLVLARRRAGLHPGFVRAVESKIQAPEPAPRAVCGWLVAAYVALGVALWVVAAVVPAPAN